MLKDDPKAAAISSRICSDIYHTGVIAENIQDTKGMYLTLMSLT
jgi:prephenate dehydratase